MLKKYVDRVGHVHLKDMRLSVVEQVKANNWSFLQAVRNGAFTVPGDGNVNFDPVFEVLAKAGILVLPIILNFYGSATRSEAFALINGSGNTKLNLCVALIDGMISRIGLSALLYFSFSMGALGCWYGDALAGFMPFVIGGIYFLSGKWKTFRRKV